MDGDRRCSLQQRERERERGREREREAVTKFASRKKRNEDRTSTFGKVIFPKGNSRERKRVEDAVLYGVESISFAALHPL